MQNVADELLRFERLYTQVLTARAGSRGKGEFMKARSKDKLLSIELMHSTSLLFNLLIGCTQFFLFPVEFYDEVLAATDSLYRYLQYGDPAEMLSVSKTLNEIIPGCDPIDKTRIRLWFSTADIPLQRTSSEEREYVIKRNDVYLSSLFEEAVRSSSFPAVWIGSVVVNPLPMLAASFNLPVSMKTIEPVVLRRTKYYLEVTGRVAEKTFLGRLEILSVNG